MLRGTKIKQSQTPTKPNIHSQHKPKPTPKTARKRQQHQQQPHPKPLTRLFSTTTAPTTTTTTTPAPGLDLADNDEENIPSEEQKRMFQEFMVAAMKEFNFDKAMEFNPHWDSIRAFRTTKLIMDNTKAKFTLLLNGELSTLPISEIEFRIPSFVYDNVVTPNPDKWPFTFVANNHIGDAPPIRPLPNPDGFLLPLGLEVLEANPYALAHLSYSEPLPTPTDITKLSKSFETHLQQLGAANPEASKIDPVQFHGLHSMIPTRALTTPLDAAYPRHHSLPATLDKESFKAVVSHPHLFRLAQKLIGENNYDKTANFVMRLPALYTLLGRLPNPKFDRIKLHAGIMSIKAPIGPDGAELPFSFQSFRGGILSRDRTTGDFTFDFEDLAGLEMYHPAMARGSKMNARLVIMETLGHFLKHTDMARDSGNLPRMSILEYLSNDIIADTVTTEIACRGLCTWLDENYNDETSVNMMKAFQIEPSEDRIQDLKNMYFTLAKSPDGISPGGFLMRAFPERGEMLDFLHNNEENAAEYAATLEEARETHKPIVDGGEEKLLEYCAQLINSKPTTIQTIIPIAHLFFQEDHPELVSNPDMNHVHQIFTGYVLDTLKQMKLQDLTPNADYANNIPTLEDFTQFFQLLSHPQSIKIQEDEYHYHPTPRALANYAIQTRSPPHRDVVFEMSKMSAQFMAKAVKQRRIELGPSYNPKPAEIEELIAMARQELEAKEDWIVIPRSQGPPKM